MTASVSTHLNFRGDARAALEFYQSVFGGTIVALTYGDAGDDAGPADQIIWGQVESDNGFRVMAYDVQTDRAWNQGENAFYVSVRCTTTDEITEYWEKLSATGTVRTPLGPSQWAPLYGMLTDKFGVIWVIDVAVAY